MAKTLSSTAKIANYNQSDLWTAATKLIADANKYPQVASPYKGLKPADLINNASWNTSFANALLGVLPATPTPATPTPAATQPVAPVVAKQNTTVTTTTPNTGPQPISAAAVAQANQQLKAANAAGFTTVADYNNALNLAQNAGFGSDLNAYNAYVAKTNAAINPAIKPAVAATTGANAIKPPTPSGAYVPPAAPVSTSVAPKPVAPVSPVPTPEAPKQDVAAIDAAQGAFTTLLNSGTVTPDQINTYRSAVTAAGGTPQQTLIDRATTQVQNTLQGQLAGVTTQAQLDNILNQAKTAGITLNQGYVDRATTAVQQAIAKPVAPPVSTSEAQTTAQRQTELQAGYNAQGAVVPTTTGTTVGSGATYGGSGLTTQTPGVSNATYGGSQLTAPDPNIVSQQNIAQLQASTNPSQAPYKTALAQLQASGQPFTYNDVISLGNNTTAAQSQAETNAFTNQAMADSANRNQQITWNDLGKIVGVVGIAALGVAAIGAIGEGALATEAASTAGGMAANGATAGEITSTLTAGGVAPEAAASIANTATGIATGTVDAGAIAEAGGITPEMLTTANASADPIATLTQSAGWTPTAEITAATSAPVAPLTELNAAQTAELMKNIDPNMISSLAPTSAGTAGGTAGSILEGTSLNPITNVLTNVGITNPIVNGALTGAATGAGINALTGRPITGDSLLMGALGGGVAGGIGSVLPDFGGGTFGSALAGAATNVGATIAVNAVTGQPITVSNLATAALTGGVVGAGISAITSNAGNTTYEYEDGSSMTTNRQGTPVAATDNTGATVPVAAVDSRTGQPKQLAPVEDRSMPVKPSGPPAGTVAVQAPDGSVLYTDGQTYYTADGTVTDISNPTPGGATDTAKLSSPNQKIITDATSDFGNNKIGWDEASARINQAVRNDIESGYLKDNGDGTYTSPDGVNYFMNRETGMYDTNVGKTGGTGSGPSTAPVTETPQPVAPPAAPVSIASETPITTPVTAEPPPVTTPVEPIVQPELPAPVAIPPVAPPAPVVTAPVETAPVVSPVETPVTTPAPVAPPAPVVTAPVETPVSGPVTTEPIIPVPAPVTTTPVAAPPVAQPVVTEPVQQPPAIVTQPPLNPVQPGPETEPNPPPPELPAPGPETEPNPPAPEQPVAPPTPVEPVYPPVYVPPIDTAPVQPAPFKPYALGPGTPLVGVGLNPGYMTNVPRYYNNPSPVSSQYFWGQHPYQPNPTVFDRALYNTLPVAPPQGWGLQQMYDPRTQTIENLLRGVGQASQVAPYNIPRAPAI